MAVSARLPLVRQDMLQDKDKQIACGRRYKKTSTEYHSSHFDKILVYKQRRKAVIKAIKYRSIRRGNKWRVQIWGHYHDYRDNRGLRTASRSASEDRRGRNETRDVPRTRASPTRSLARTRAHLLSAGVRVIWQQYSGIINCTFSPSWYLIPW